MYVCVCNAITERHIGQAVDEGMCSLRELREQLGVGAECGRCARHARECMHAALGGGSSLAPAAAAVGLCAAVPAMEAA
ncbi:MAG: bacterioferritin [Thauera phenolivorans]|uniref:Bacterioferritin-associated ferredoxin n=1 Tax=Thauera phenolivorans TaxID=1792543 RepID=A0A7X7R853_9RHOO|nr:bacterioferritin-associated ferredoxin [Thauera phenolivorans]NLF54417.1 bacterioferritin [Thauera phenolivorans]